MNIRGKDCTLTLLRDGVYTGLPYLYETMREAPRTYQLAECVGSTKRNTTIETTPTAAGCFATFITPTCAEELFTILKESSSPFSLISNHIYKRTTFKNILIDTFTLKSEIDSETKLLINTTPSHDTMAEETGSTVPEAEANTKDMFRFNGNKISVEGNECSSIYAWSLNGSCKGIKSYTLNIHTPLDTNSVMLTKKRFSRIELRLNKEWKITCYEIAAKSNLEKIETADEVLAVKEFRVEGIITIEKQTTSEIWSVTL